MKRILSIVLALCMLLSCAVFFSGCNSAKSSEYPVTVGNVTINSEPQNIVVLNDVFADIISYIGYDIKMVGRSVECDQEFLYIVPSVGTAASPDVNAIKKAEADFVIADSAISADTKSSLEADGITVLTLDAPKNEAELKQLYIDLGTALGGKVTGSAKGEKGYTDLLEMLSTLNTATSNVVQTVAYLYMNESNELCTFVKGSLEYKFFNYNGNSNVFANQQKPLVNTMELRIGSPNYIFYDSEEVLAYLATDENTQNLAALYNNRICQIPKKSFFRFGSSTEEAVFEMLRFIEKDSKATPDEADEEEIVPATEPEQYVTDPADTEEEAQDENVIEYTITEE